MKNKKSIKQIGVWMDHESAKFLEPTSPKDNEGARTAGETTMDSKLGNKHSSNGESHTHHREQHERHTYFKQVADKLAAYDEIFITGPSKAHNEFENYLRAEKHFNGKKIHAEAADYITDNQFAASVHEFFKNKKGFRAVVQ